MNYIFNLITSLELWKSISAWHISYSSLTSSYKKAGFLSTRYCHKIYEPERTGLSETWFQSTLEERMLKVWKKRSTFIWHSLQGRCKHDAILSLNVCLHTYTHTHLCMYECRGARQFIHYHPVSFYTWEIDSKFESPLSMLHSLICKYLWFNYRAHVLQLLSPSKTHYSQINK